MIENDFVSSYKNVIINSTPNILFYYSYYGLYIYDIINTLFAYYLSLISM